MLSRAVERYQSAIFLADEWLEGRGIGESARDTFRLGVVASPEPGHEHYEGWLCIPYLDRLGRVLKVRFRCIEDHGEGVKCRDLKHGKYQDLPHETARTFNTKAIFDADMDIHVTEGELDAVILEQAGLPAIALPGANQWQPHHRRMLAGFEHIYVWGDPDSAGAEFTSSILSSMRQAQPVHLTVGDVNETYIRGGEDALYELLEEVTW